MAGLSGLIIQDCNNILVGELKCPQIKDVFYEVSERSLNLFSRNVVE